MFLDTADRIGARLCRDALWSGSRCNWFGSYWGNDGETGHRTLGSDVYSGTSGIALFLGHLFQATGEEIFRITAEGAMRQALSRWNSAERPGFYSGATGIAFASVRVGEIADNSGFIEEGLAIAGSSAVKPRPAFLDVIDGSASAIPVSFHLHRKRGSDSWPELAIRHGDALVNAANKADSGWSWTTLGRSQKDLTGFSHGAAGIAWALLELFQEIREDKFRAAAEEGFATSVAVSTPSGRIGRIFANPAVTISVRPRGIPWRGAMALQASDCRGCVRGRFWGARSIETKPRWLFGPR
jgi:lantibiotic modifying enzyme